MLNKNQSKKWNSWKYALVLPVLIAFVFLFQMEVIAKEKNHNSVIEKSTKTSNDADIYKINKNTTEAELKEKAAEINTNYGVEVRFTNTKRNTNNELTAITVEIKKGKEIAEKRAIKSSEAIKTFAIVINKNSDGKLTVDFTEEDATTEKPIVISNSTNHRIQISDDTKVFINGADSDKAEMEKLDPKEIATVNVINSNGEKEIRIITKKFNEIGNDNEIYINDTKVTQNDLNELDQKTIERMDINKNGKTIIITTKNGVRTIHDKNMPVPPTPPTPPTRNFKTPVHPALPKAPTPPKENPVTGDKKAWDDFEKKMQIFDAKMKKLEPQMEAFDKQMAEFDKQMEPFNKEMEAFDEKMKVYEKQLNEYLAKQEK